MGAGASQASLRAPRVNSDPGPRSAPKGWSELIRGGRAIGEESSRTAERAKGGECARAPERAMNRRVPWRAEERARGVERTIMLVRATRCEGTTCGERANSEEGTKRVERAMHAGGPMKEQAKLGQYAKALKRATWMERTRIRGASQPKGEHQA